MSSRWLLFQTMSTGWLAPYPRDDWHILHGMHMTGTFSTGWLAPSPQTPVCRTRQDRRGTSWLALDPQDSDCKYAQYCWRVLIVRGDHPKLVEFNFIFCYNPASPQCSRRPTDELWFLDVVVCSWRDVWGDHKLILCTGYIRLSTLNNTLETDSAPIKRRKHVQDKTRQAGGGGGGTFSRTNYRNDDSPIF